MKKVLAAILGLVLVVACLLAMTFVPYGVGYLAMGCAPPESLGTTHWITGFFLIIIGLICWGLWRIAYEGIHDWFK